MEYKPPTNILSQLYNSFSPGSIPSTSFLNKFMPVKRTLPVTGQSFQSYVMAPQTGPIAPAPTVPVVSNPTPPLVPTPQRTIPPVAPASTVPTAQASVDYSKYTDPVTGQVMSPQQYAEFLAKRVTGGSVANYAGNTLTQGPQTTAQLQSTATDLNNQRNDIATGTTDPYGIGSKSGIAYSPSELQAIEKAYAGIYDPALKDVFSRLETKQKEDASALENKNKLSQMAQQHQYDIELKKTPSGDKVGGDNVPGYSGEFAGTIDLVSNMESSVTGKRDVKQQLKNLIANKDYGTAYSQIANTIENVLVGESKQKYVNARTDLAVMEGMKKAIKNYADAGGNMGLLKGTEEEIKRKLGIDSGKASALATQLWREFQVYRNNMTGAASGAGESRDYASVNATLGKSLDLNLSVIQGAQDQLKNRINSTIDQRVPGAKYIKEYAEGAQSNNMAAPESEVNSEYQQWLKDNNLI